MDGRERFLKAATEPFADNAELEMAARRELAAMIGDRDGEFEPAIRRLEKAGKRGGRLPGRGLLLVATLVIGTACLLPTVRQVTELAGLFTQQQIPLLGSFLIPTANPDAGWAQALTDEERLLLFGDPAATGAAAKAKPLWRSDPRNPAFFSEYAAGHLTERSSLPPDFLETAEQIDPDNGWFAALAAAKGGRAVEKERLSYKERQAGKRAEWTVTDPAGFERSLELLRTAAAKPRFDSYHTTLGAERARLLPPRTNMLDQMVPMAYLYSLPYPRLELRKLADVVAPRCSQAAVPGDADWLKELVADWERILIAQLADEDGNVLDGLLVKTQVSYTAPVITATVEAMGEDEEARRWQSIDEATDTRASHNPEAGGELRSRLAERSVVFGGGLPSLQGMTSQSPEIGDEDLKVLTSIEHAAFG